VNHPYFPGKITMNDSSLTVSILPERLAICQLPAAAPIPAWATAEPFFSISRTADELSIVCPETQLPAEGEASRGWRALKLQGPFDFELVGILLRLAEPLAAAGISIFPVGTYETDYVLVREAALATAVTVLRQAGHTIMNVNDI
jgi:uncharacterized protein